MRLAIIGAGWAGLAAAVYAADKGYQVCIFEASHSLGGRARSLISKKLDHRIDNGQHLFLGAYTQTLALMQRLRPPANTYFLQKPLHLYAAAHNFQLKLPAISSPWHLLLGLWQAHGLSLSEKYGLLHIIRQLKKQNWTLAEPLTVQQWLDTHQQSPHICQVFWYPLCIAAMNTPVHQACAQLFANVLRDSLGSHSAASNMLFAREYLSELWPDHVENIQPQHPQGNIKIKRGHAINHISFTSDQAVQIDNQAFDALIIASNASSAHRILSSLPEEQLSSPAAQNLLAQLEAFRFIPIASLSLEFETRWKLPLPLYMLHEDRNKAYYGQWLFNQYFLNKENLGKSQRHFSQVVISDAQTASELGASRLFDAVKNQLRDQTAGLSPMPTVINFDLIVEKRATFAAVTGLQRPKVRTPWPKLFLAGDWTDTGYPAVLEGAVRSGHAAAMALPYVV